MLNTPLPQSVDPRKLAEQGARITASLPLANLSRMQDLLLDHQGDVEVQLQFGRDEQRLLTIVGQIEAQLVMQCQRCLQAVDLPLNVDVSLAIVADDEGAARLPKVYDPLIVASQYINLHEVVEEELLLSMPSMPYHEDCSIKVSFGDAVTDKAATSKPNPFSVLADLKVKPPQRNRS